MPSLSDQRKERIEDMVEYGQQFKGTPTLYDKLFVYARRKHPTLTRKTIESYTEQAVMIILEDYTHEIKTT